MYRMNTRFNRWAQVIEVRRSVGVWSDGSLGALTLLPWPRFVDVTCTRGVLWRVRVIAGAWRGRRITFAEIPGVLPGSIPAARPPQLHTHNDSHRDAYCRCQGDDSQYQYKQHHSGQGCHKTSGPAYPYHTEFYSTAMAYHRISPVFPVAHIRC
jgi:hypothetical protein